VILIDSNVFMYAAGAVHPNKEPSASWLAAVARGEIDAAIDAEVLQEILHRYRAIRRWEEGKIVFDLARQIVPLVLPIEDDTLIEARGLLDAHESLSARDAVHAAVVRLSSLEAICSYDRDFDDVEGVVRITPGDSP
jgi:uncharacterized protein